MDRDGFLRRGWTRAYLNDDGEIPSERERLTGFVMIGPSSLKQSFRTKKSRNVLAREDASGDSGSEFEGFR